MKNLKSTIEFKNYHCLQSLAWLLFLPIFLLSAQNLKETKSGLEEGVKYFTPQITGSNPAVKPAFSKTPVHSKATLTSAGLQDQQAGKFSKPLTWPQLQKRIISAKTALSEESIFTGIGTQRAPNIISTASEKFIAFESDDIEGGVRPHGTIKIYNSIDGGATWNYFDALYNTSYKLTDPKIVIIGTDVIVSYLSAGVLWTSRWGRSDASFSSKDVPVPTTSATEFIIDQIMVSDEKEFSSSNYLYIAYLFKQADGKNKVLFSLSYDTARTWEPFLGLGVTQPELGVSTFGLDYSSSGIFVSYLGTDTSAGSILLRKSTLFGMSWSPEIKLPMYFNGGPNKKVGPAVSAMGSRVAVVYQYDYYGDAIDATTGSDFDIYAIVSSDGGSSWEERMVNATFRNETLPSIACDYDENFYVAYKRAGRNNVSMAGQEYAFGVPDTSLSTNANMDDFPAICGAQVIGDNTAFTAWTETGNITGLDIYGAATVLKIPPASPSNLSATSISNTQVKLSWTDNSYDELGFDIYSRHAGTSDYFDVIATVGANVQNYTVTGLSASSGYEFYVRAFNPNGYSLRTNIETTYPTVIDNTPPTVTLNGLSGTPVIVNANGQVGSTPTVNATSTDAESGVYQMQVAYRNTTEQNWTYSTPVNSNSINFQIPGNKFILNNKPIGVNFRVGAWDNAGNVAWSPYSSIDVKLGDQVGDAPSFALPAASQLTDKTSAYRIISVPYNLSNKQPAKLLANFGSHSENNVSYARWRFQRYVNGQYQDYDQFSTENAITPGSAFFFIVRDQDQQLKVQGESINRSDIMYGTGIPLQNGWNLVGNPFNTPYPIDSLEFFNATTSARSPIRQRAYYSGTGPVSGWDTIAATVNKIQPWSGVALFVNTNGTLKFPSTGQRNALPKSSSQLLEKISTADWTMGINAYRNDIGRRCEGSSIGLAQGAKEGDDSYDLYIPPIVGDKNVAIYFRNSDGAMMRDVRPLNNDGNIWDMKVVTGDADANVKLQWSDNLNLPNSAFEAYLIDTDQKTAYNLKQIHSLEINSGSGMRNFRVVVGKEAFVEGNNSGIALIPSAMKLYTNYPNPFNPETIIRYSIPGKNESYKVMLKIFNLLGQEITTLVDEQKSPGYYEVKFNGANQSSGIYLYQISIAGSKQVFREVKKMVLMK